MLNFTLKFNTYTFRTLFEQFVNLRSFDFQPLVSHQLSLDIKYIYLYQVTIDVIPTAENQNYMRIEKRSKLLKIFPERKC